MAKKTEGLHKRTIRKYGWNRDLPDPRDLAYEPDPATYPPIDTVMLIDKYNFSKPYNQGNLGSCTANGIAFLAQFYLMNKSLIPNPSAKVFMPSRLFIYWWERFIEGTVNFDSGAQIRDGIKVLAAKGVCSEDKWPYDVDQFTVKPPTDAAVQAKKFQALQYRRINNSNKAALVAALHFGFPVVFGFTVFTSFESDEVEATGIVPMPSANDSILGGHCCVVVGYNKEGDYYLCRNSWGDDWGINGYFKMPAAYIEDRSLSSDFWILIKLEEGTITN
jgi:C1A family cysteine protease